MLQDALDIATFLAVVLYAPFAKTWTRSLWVCVTVGLTMATYVVVTIHLNPSSSASEPLGGLLVLPFLLPIVGLVARGIKIGIFRVAMLDQVELKIRGRMKETLSRRSEKSNAK
jgi:hypothetical protein